MWTNYLLGPNVSIYAAAAAADGRRGSCREAAHFLLCFLYVMMNTLDDFSLSISNGHNVNLPLLNFFLY